MRYCLLLISFLLVSCTTIKPIEDPQIIDRQEFEKRQKLYEMIQKDREGKSVWR